MARILIVEDDPALRGLIRVTLDSGAFEILEAEDGPGALEMARRTRPDLIFLDWQMPGMSGLAVARALRAEAATAATRIVMVTARQRKADEESGRRAGVDDFIVKPFSPVRLLDKVVEVLGPEALLE
jgi:two-component system phosphate regulon response regulator PhoB